jgi:hypothetical protein
METGTNLVRIDKDHAVEVEGEQHVEEEDLVAMGVHRGQ